MMQLKVCMSIDYEIEVSNKYLELVNLTNDRIKNRVLEQTQREIELRTELKDTIEKMFPNAKWGNEIGKCNQKYIVAVQDFDGNGLIEF